MIYIIAKPTALEKKHAKALEAVKQVFDRAEKKYEILPTERAGHAREYAREICAKEGFNAVVAMGGDGTLHEIVNGITDFSKVAVGLIPNGTGNDFAAAAGIPPDPKEAAEIIAFREPQFIDFIQLSSGLRSVNAVGMGIDVDVLRRTYSGKKTGKGKYFAAFLKSLVKFKSYNFTVEYEGVSQKRFGLIAALGNGKQIGGGIKLFPDAKIDDGYMDLLIVDYLSKPRLVSAFLKLMRGKVNSVKEATAVKVKEAKFICESENFTIQAEGELYDNVPIEAKVVSEKLRFYLPERNA